MIEVTEAAKEQLQTIIEERELPPGRFLRLTVPPAWTGEGDFGIVVDDRGSSDLAITLNGVTVLVIGPEMADGVQRSKLDCKASPDGPRFTLDVY